tara:strand:- start:321 stop:497 length:177 start_codon:yes stop_codon:yes gene_type:complete
MELNLNTTDNAQAIVDRDEKLISTDKLDYLYPIGHRMPNQMRWFKGSRHRGLRSNIAA